MIKLIRSFFYLSLRQRLPRLNPGLADPFKADDLEADIELILRTGRARDPKAARELLEFWQAENPGELLDLLPPYRADWRTRLRNWIRGIERSYATDPDEYQRQRARDRNAFM